MSTQEDQILKAPKKPPRERAEELLRAPHGDLASISAEDARILVHELQIHQVELQMQNEELRAAQVELAHAHDRFADLYEFAPVGYVTLDRHGVIEQINLTASGMLGIEKARLLGRKFTDFVADHSQGDWHIHCRDILSGEGAKTRTCELEMKHTPRPGLTLQLHSRPAHSEQGHPLQIHIALADVTERKLNIDLEQSLADRTSELQSSVERVALLSVSNLTEGVMITVGGLAWPGPKIIFVNKALCRITGYSAEELIGETPRILQGVETDPGELEKLRQALAANLSHSCEVVNYRKDGTPYDAELWVNPIPNPGGEGPNFIGLHRDISERKLAERALRSLYEFSESLIETAPNLILVLDPQGRVMRFNPAFEKIFGWSLAEAEGADWFENFLPKGDHKRIRKVFSEALGVNSTRSEKNVVLTRTGEERLIEWHNSALKDAEGKVTGVLCSGTDVTERVRLEQEVLNAVEEQQQRFAHDLHDDLGSLLTSIGLRANVLSGSLAKSGKEKWAADSDAIKSLVQSAVSKTRLIAKGLSPMGGHPGDLVESLAELVARVDSASLMPCRFDSPEPVVVDDPLVANHLFRIAQESVNNAVKHSRGSEVVVSLKTDNGQLLLEISDNGTGFDRSQLKSSGLGLHIMSYRAAAIGATLKIGRGETCGTKITCTRQW